MKYILIKILTLGVFTSFFFSCAKDEVPIIGPNGSSRFTGHYQFKFYFGMTGNALFYVDENGKFEYPLSISNIGSFTAKGDVYNSGIFRGKLYRDTTTAGTLEGQIYLNDNGGGTCNLDGQYGFWSATYIY